MINWPSDHAHLGHGAGAVKGDIGDAGGRWRIQHGRQLRAAVRVHAHHQVVQGHVISVILGEQGPHGAVDDSGGEDGVLGSLSLSLVEASGDLATEYNFLLIFHAQGEEIDPLSGLCGRGRPWKEPPCRRMHERGAVGLGRTLPTSTVSVLPASSMEKLLYMVCLLFFFI